MSIMSPPPTHTLLWGDILFLSCPSETTEQNFTCRTQWLTGIFFYLQLCYLWNWVRPQDFILNKFGQIHAIVAVNIVLRFRSNMIWKKRGERKNGQWMLTGKLDKGSLTILTFIWSINIYIYIYIYISVNTIFQSLLFLSGFPW
jgi:hypothetical protein